LKNKKGNEGNKTLLGWKGKGSEDAPKQRQRLICILMNLDKLPVESLNLLTG